MRASNILVTALCATAEAASIGQSPRTIPHGVHSEYSFHESELKLQLLLPYYEEDAIVKLLSSNFTPTVHYVRRTDASLGLEDRDICAKITDCAGQAAESAAAWAAVAQATIGSGCNSIAGAVYDFLVADDYQYARQVLFNDVILALIVNIIATPIQYKINAKLDAVWGPSNTNDACGDSNPETFSNNAASAIYQFCRTIQSEKLEQATTNYEAIDETSANVPGGYEGLAKFFVSSQAGIWGPICHDLGIDWKKRLLRRFGF